MLKLKSVMLLAGMSLNVLMAQTIYDSGGVEILNAPVLFQDIEVQNASGGAATTLQLQSGVLTSVDRYLAALGSSRIEMSDGTVEGFMVADEEGSLLITGGTVTQGVELYDRGSARIEGGNIGSEDTLSIFATGETEVTITGGNFLGANLDAGGDETLLMLGISTADISGGTFAQDLVFAHGSTGWLSGGSFQDDLILDHDARVFMSGGTLADDAEVFGDAYLEMSGGIILEDLEAYGGSVLVTGGTLNQDITVGDGGHIVIRGGNLTSGSRFEFDGDGMIELDVQELWINGTLQGRGSYTLQAGDLVSGTLQNGDSFSNVGVALASAGTQSLVVIPELSSGLLLLLSLGGFGLLLQIRRGK